LFNVKDASLLEQVMNINFYGAMNTCFFALPYLRESSGHIVVTSSVLGKLVVPTVSAYCASKHALHGFFDVVRMEEARNRIQVTLVCPGYVPTEIFKTSFDGTGKPLEGRGEDIVKTLWATPLKQAVKIMIEATAAGKKEVWYTWRGHFWIVVRSLMPNFLDTFLSTRPRKSNKAK